MKIFVTGGTGFIGSHFLRVAGETCHEILALRRSAHFPSISVKENVVWVEKQMDTITAKDLQGVDALVHLASPGVSPKKACWPELLYWNVVTLLQLLQAAKNAAVPRIVIAGTFAEYGRAGERYELIPPNAPLEPTFPYAASKAAGFLVAQAFCVEQALEFCYLRIFSAFGEGQHITNFWPALRDAAKTGRDFEMTLGEQIRDYIPVAHVAVEFLKAVERTDISPGIPLVRNIGSGNAVSMREFAETWWARSGATGTLRVGVLPYRPNEVMRYVPLI